MADQTNNERLHAMDALRAVAMLLGIALHAMMAYMDRVWKEWPADDDASNHAFNIAFWIIHLFRMEVFFVMAGFFACLLLARYGLGGYLKNRGGRIAGPLALAMVTILPLVSMVWIWGGYVQQPAGGRLSYWAMVGQTFSHRKIDEYFQPAHLWFLEHLLILCVGAGLLHMLATRVEVFASLGEKLADGWAWIVRRGLAAIAFGTLAFPILLLQEGPGVDTQVTSLPAWRVVLYYTPFFVGGWLLYRRRHELMGLARFWHVQLALGIALALLYYHLKRQLPGGADVMLQVRIVAAMATGLLVVGFSGMFLRLFDRPSRVMRYISDSTYWLYIIHLPLVVALNIALLPLQAPAVVKFALVCLIAAVVMLGSYQLFVRYTWIGFFLNGPRIRLEREHRRAESESAARVGGAAAAGGQ